MVWDLTKFDFGVAEGVEEPGVEPDPRDYIAYTVYHIARALEYHNFKTNATIEPILQAFSPVSCRRAPAPVARIHRGAQLTCDRGWRSSAPSSQSSDSGTEN